MFHFFPSIILEMSITTYKTHNNPLLKLQDADHFTIVFQAQNSLSHTLEQA